ncbi:MAG: hypothetical protein Ta2D_13600 [Rickettsiales bacterium]|nr:MAG: hypothetical protein Ta2D_13600 [Rickettsiales bacterium]
MKINPNFKSDDEIIYITEFESDDGGWEMHSGSKYVGWCTDEERKAIEQNVIGGGHNDYKYCS